MIVHTARVRGRHIAWDRREVVQHGLNSDEVRLDLDAEWGACDRVQAVLAGAGGPVRVLAEGGRFGIPSALMERPGAIRMCLMGHAGDSVRIVTAREAAPLAVVESGETAGLDPAPERPDLWARLMAEVARAVAAAEGVDRRADAGEFDGAGISAGAREPSSMDGARAGDLYINTESGELYELVEY